ncbi:MAG: porin family protein [Bacteroidota bacterium]
MKKVLSTLVCILAFALTSQAQEIKFGLKGGATFSNWNGKLLILDINGNSLTNFHGGLMVHLGLSDRFGIQPELLYNTMGSNLSNTGVLSELLNLSNLQGEVDFGLSYISLPIYAKLYAAEGFALMAGPQFNFKVDNQEDISVQGISTALDIINFYNDVDFGLSFGAQYEADFGLTVGANYYLGLSDVIDNPIISELRNSAFQVSVGWFLFP